MNRILIVEDELFSLQALQCAIELLYPDQFEILSANNGLDALNLCQQKEPDIVLADLNIPGISGLNLIHTLADYQFPGKIIIITAHDRSKYIREALSLGVVSYLLKPLDLDELHSSIDKCLEQLAQQKTAQIQNFKVLFSYAQSYLIRDILSCNAPQNILSDIYGWATDGSLSAALLIWCPNKKVSTDEQRFYLNAAYRRLDRYFSLISTTSQGNVLIFLHALSARDTQQLLTISYACMQMLRRDIPSGSLILSKISATYNELYGSMKKCLFLAEHETNTFLNANPSATCLWTEEYHLRLRQKFVQRLEEKQTIQFIQYLKRKFEYSQTIKPLSSCPGSETDSSFPPDTFNGAWEWVALFLEAVEILSPSEDLCRILNIFQSQNRFLLLENWLNEFYSKIEASSSPVSKTDRAIRIIEQNFSQELTQETVATELGLTPTYFSSIFKKETGSSFPQYLAQYRIKHAIQLIIDGERDLETIAETCGFHNKKYFLEIFKKYSGYSITQFIEQLH